ncbi:MAG: hypothetical protein WA861_05770, partial [Candidatus Binatus sp.]
MIPTINIGECESILETQLASSGPLDHLSWRRDNFLRPPGRAECRQKLAGAQLCQSNPHNAEFVVKLKRLRGGFCEQSIARQESSEFRLHSSTHEA